MIKLTADEEISSSEAETIIPVYRQRHSIMGDAPRQRPTASESSDTSSTSHSTDDDDRESSSSLIQLDLPDPGAALETMPCATETHMAASPTESRLYLTDSWLFKGLREHVEDLRFSDVVIDSDKVVTARKKIDVLGEYTFIETTPTQRQTAEMFPAVYVPGEFTSFALFHLSIFPFLHFL